MHYVEQVFGHNDYYWEIKETTATSRVVVVTGRLAINQGSLQIIREGVGFAALARGGAAYPEAAEAAFKQACEMFGAGNQFEE